MRHLQVFYEYLWTPRPPSPSVICLSLSMQNWLNLSWIELSRGFEDILLLIFTNFSILLKLIRVHFEKLIRFSSTIHIILNIFQYWRFDWTSLHILLASGKPFQNKRLSSFLRTSFFLSSSSTWGPLPLHIHDICHTRGWARKICNRDRFSMHV